MPEEHSRHAVWKDMTIFARLKHVYVWVFFQNGVASKVRNAKEEVLFVNFLSLLAGTFDKSSAFTDFVFQAHDRRPSSMAQPWRCVVDTDEMHFGNMLNSSTGKAWCTYLSFLEAGKLLSRSDCRFCVYMY